jgi:NAD(P)-dependent dehydrogenase (short-subunit alcohol dehydrogenase family)
MLDTHPMQDHDQPLQLPPQGRQTWLVTGASAGIGLAVCQILHAAGHDVTGFGRRQAQDLPAGFPDIAYHTVDLATSQGCDLLAARAPHRLDRALLNAGLGHYRPLCRETPQAISDVLAVNLLAPMMAAHGLFGALLAGQGVLGLVGSTAYRGAAAMPPARRGWTGSAGRCAANGKAASMCASSIPDPPQPAWPCAQG